VIKDNVAMYPRAFHYHRASSLSEAAAMLRELAMMPNCWLVVKA